jgi:trimeric autotransporter adhesin
MAHKSFAATLTITARAVDSSGQRSTRRSLMLNIEQGTQQITGFTPPATLTYVPAPNNTLTLTATGSATNNPVTFSSTTPSICTTGGNNGATLTIVTAGTCTITANQAGNANYLAAPEVTASISINKAAQVITGFNPPQTLNQAAGSTLTLTAAGGESNNPVTFSSTTPSICTTGGNNGATLTIVTAGTCTVTANQAADDNFQAATPVSATVTIGKASQSITGFTLPATASYAPDLTFPLTATGGGATSPIVFHSLTPAVCYDEQPAIPRAV